MTTLTIQSIIDNNCSDCYIFDWSFNETTGILTYGGEVFNLNDYENDEEFINDLVESIEMMS